MRLRDWPYYETIGYYRKITGHRGDEWVGIPHHGTMGVYHRAGKECISWFYIDSAPSPAQQHRYDHRCALIARQQERDKERLRPKVRNRLWQAVQHYGPLSIMQTDANEWEASAFPQATYGAGITVTRRCPLEAAKVFVRLADDQEMQEGRI